MELSKIVAESTSVEYKLSLEESKPKSWLKTVSAFANSKGGTLFFGIRDADQARVGLADIHSVSEKITELINARIQPCPRYEQIVLRENEKDFLAVKVGDGPTTPYYYTQEGTREAFVRKGNQSVVATSYELNRLIMKGMNRTFDALTSSCKFGDASFTLLQATFKQETGNDFDLQRDLISLGLMQPDRVITNAGLLLSDQGVLKQSRIFCTHWKGLEKGDLDLDAYDDKEYYGSIISLLFNAEDFIRNNSKTRWRIAGMRREESSDYPAKSVREVLVNAIIHRDYQILGSEIHVDMYDDRLEITSPGGMPDGSRIQELDIRNIPSMRRNHVISDIFLRLDYMDRRGSGINRILKDFSDCPVKPKFFSEASWFRVSMPNRNDVLRKKTSISDGESAVPGKKSAFLERKTALLDDESALPEEETALFEEKKLKERLKNISGLSEKTRNNILVLLRQFETEIGFNRMNIMSLLGVKERRAIDIINLLLKHDLIEKVKTGEYVFKRMEK